MPDLQDLAHFNAVLSLVRADPTLRLYPDAEGFTPDVPTLPYARVYFWIERPADAAGNSLNGTAQQWIAYFDFHCVGENEYSAAAMQMRVSRLVLDQRPVVGGRSCGLVRQVECPPPVKDNTSGRDVFDGRLQIRFTSN